MGSGSCHLAQITGPAKDNSKGASRATPNFFKIGQNTFSGLCFIHIQNGHGS